MTRPDIEGIGERGIAYGKASVTADKREEAWHLILEDIPALLAYVAEQDAVIARLRAIATAAIAWESAYHACFCEPNSDEYEGLRLMEESLAEAVSEHAR